MKIAVRDNYGWETYTKWRSFQMNRKSLLIPLAFGLGLTVVLLWLTAYSDTSLRVVRAASYTVCPTGPPSCDYSVIQDAVDAATGGMN